MPKFDKYQDSENKEFVLMPAGDCVAEVTAIDESLSKAGDAKWDIKLRIFKDGHAAEAMGNTRESLTAVASCQWRWETFAKCMNYRTLRPGDEFDPKPHEFIGSRGWIKLGVEEMRDRADKPMIGDDGKPMKKNVVRTWYTNKEKFQRKAIAGADVPENPDWS